MGFGEGGAGRALQHMDNIAKLAGAPKSIYAIQTNTVPFQVNSLQNRERSRHAKEDSRRPFLHGRRKPHIADVSLAQASLPEFPDTNTTSTLTLPEIKGAKA